MAERPQQLTQIRPVRTEDTALLERFVRGLPEGDRTFLKEDLNPRTFARHADERHSRWAVVGDDGELRALLSLIPGTLWSSHVGELRLVVGAGYRRQGYGRRLARFGLAEAVRLGLSKIIVEVAADKEGDISMFTSIGFDPEALLRDHIRDRDGNLRDLVVLSHDVDARASSLDVIGLEAELGAQA
jgi:GNAT superfamily N-acetyltransferase